MSSIFNLLSSFIFSYFTFSPSTNVKLKFITSQQLAIYWFCYMGWNSIYYITDSLLGTQRDAHLRVKCSGAAESAEQITSVPP